MIRALMCTKDASTTGIRMDTIFHHEGSVVSLDPKRDVAVCEETNGALTTHIKEITSHSNVPSKSGRGRAGDIDTQLNIAF